MILQVLVQESTAEVHWAFARLGSEDVAEQCLPICPSVSHLPCLQDVHGQGKDGDGQPLYQHAGQPSMVVLPDVSPP